MSKYLSRHENKTYPLMLTERSEATEATEARQGHKTSQIGKHKSTEFKEWNYGHLIYQFLAQGRMISCEGHTFVDDSLSDFTRCGTIFTCSSLPSIPMYPYSPTALSTMYTSLQCCSSKLEQVIQVSLRFQCPYNTSRPIYRITICFMPVLKPRHPATVRQAASVLTVLLVQTFVTSHEGHTPLRIHLQVTSDAERLEQKHHVQTCLNTCHAMRTKHIHSC